MTTTYKLLAVAIIGWGLIGLSALWIRHLINEERLGNSQGKAFAFFRKFDINDSDGALYLRRWRVIETPWFRIFVHKILTQDKDPDPHDHPWNFFSLVLWGGYVERVWLFPHIIQVREDNITSVIRSRKPFRGHRMPMDMAHKILSVRPNTYTLVVAGPRVQEWGFYTGAGWVYFKEYLDRIEQVKNDYPVVDGEDARICTCHHIAQKHVHFDSHRSYCGECDCNGFILEVKSS